MPRYLSLSYAIPFVHIPENATIEQLQHDRPLLLQAIVFVAWPFAREMEACARELKHSLCEMAFCARHQRLHLELAEPLTVRLSVSPPLPQIGTARRLYRDLKPSREFARP